MSDDTALLEEARRLEMQLWDVMVKAARRYKTVGDADSGEIFANVAFLHGKAQRRYERRWRAWMAPRRWKEGGA